jgi:hypothetical protein
MMPTPVNALNFYSPVEDDSVTVIHFSEIRA